MIHPEEAALYASVLASPQDNTVRLVMADWYDEHEQPERAELIRVGVELARTEDPQYQDVKTIGYLTPQPPGVESGCVECLKAKDWCRFHALKRRQAELLAALGILEYGPEVGRFR